MRKDTKATKTYVVSKMVSKSDSEALFCPRCGRETNRSEWRPIFRWLRGSGGAFPRVDVLKHRLCKEVVYFVVE